MRATRYSFSAHSRASGNPKPPARDSGSPKFTNEVQHLLREVLQWGANTSSCHWRTDARLPDFRPTGARSGKSRQLWIARHRPSLVRQSATAVATSATNQATPRNRRRHGAGRARASNASPSCAATFSSVSPAVGRPSRSLAGSLAKEAATSSATRASTASSTPRSPVPKTTAGGAICRAARASAVFAAARAAAPQPSSKAVFPWPNDRPQPPTAAPPVIGRPTSCCSPSTAKPCSPFMSVSPVSCSRVGHPTRPPIASPRICARSSKTCLRGCAKPSPSTMAPSSPVIGCFIASPSKPSFAIPTRPGRRAVSKTPSVVCAASSHAKLTLQPSRTNVFTLSCAPTTTPHESALTSKRRQRCSTDCCTSNVNPPPRFRGDERMLADCAQPNTL